MGRGESKHEGTVKKERWDGWSDTLFCNFASNFGSKKETVASQLQQIFINCGYTLFFRPGHPFSGDCMD